MSVAVLGTVSTDHTRTLVAHGTDLDAALLSGYQLAFRIGAAGVAVALLAAVLFVRSPRRAEIVAATLAGPEARPAGERRDRRARANPPPSRRPRPPNPPPQRAH